METDNHFAESLLDDDGEKVPVSTLIFMDLETTGLPGDVGKRNVQVTEISFVAIDRNDFETDTTMRVLNKLSLSVRPRARVSPGAMYITGLYNDVLQSQEEFDDSIPKMLEFFFRRLRPPICLLAHNGKKFDFPVLQAELKRLHFHLDCSILCADTLEGFRNICRNFSAVKKVPQEKNLVHSKEKPNQDQILKLSPFTVNLREEFHSENNEIEKLLLEDIESFQNIEEPKERNDISESTLQDSNKTSHQNKNNPSIEFISISDDERTPTRTKNNATENNVKQVRKKNRSEIIFNQNTLKQETKQRNTLNPHSVTAKRKLFADQISEDNNSVTEINLNKIVGFSLEKLYYHFFGEAPPKSHYAEADCIALSKVCQKIQKEFLNWLDNNYSTFSEVESLW